MATFVAGRPIRTAEPVVVVDAGLPVGLHRFRLEVVTDTGQTSPPDEAVVQVQAPTTTLGVLSPLASPTEATTSTLVSSPSPRLAPKTAPTGTASVAPDASQPAPTSTPLRKTGPTRPGRKKRSLR